MKYRKARAVGEISKVERSPLLPDRHPQMDFFVCDIFDAAPKADIGPMEHPVFSLSSRPDTNIRRYEHGNVVIEVKPSVDGLATVHDRDILIYCISQLIHGMNDGRETSRIVRFKAYDLLTATNRTTNGQGYAGLKAALERLRGTTISTNITTGGVEQLDIFGLINRATIVRQTRDGRMQEVEVELSDWVFNAIRAREVLTLSREYFRLRKPIERRIYELARKHCGRQKSWRISLDVLQKKCGSSSELREFRRVIAGISQEDETHDHMPDYAVRFEEEKDQVLFISKGRLDVVDEADLNIPPLDEETYDLARALAPGWDIHYIEREWRSWATETPKSADAAFLGFCRKWSEKRGRP